MILFSSLASLTLLVFRFCFPSSSVFCFLHQRRNGSEGLCRCHFRKAAADKMEMKAEKKRGIETEIRKKEILLQGFRLFPFQHFFLFIYLFFWRFVSAVIYIYIFLHLI